MPWFAGAAISILTFIVLIFFGMPVSFAFASVGIVGTFLLIGPIEVYSAVVAGVHTVSGIGILVIPLFILMANVISTSRISTDIFDAAYKWLGRAPGGVGIVSTAASAIFGAICGSSTAAAAAMGRLSLPELTRLEYDKGLSSGLLALGTTLAVIIPPSTVMAFYGILTETAIGPLFMAGIIPGIILAVLIITYTIVRVKLNPSLAPGEGRGYTWGERFGSLGRLWSVLVLIVAVLGAIYLGICSATEAAAVGALVAFIIMWAGYRELNWTNLQHILKETLFTSGFILFIVIGAAGFTFILNRLGVAGGIADFIAVAGVNRWAVLIMMQVIFFILGLFMDIVGVLMLTMPIFFPLVQQLGFDPIWFGVVATLNMQIGLVTPPVGFNVYVIAGIGKDYGIEMGDVFKGVAPLIGLAILTLVLVEVFPQLALWIPSTM